MSRHAINVWQRNWVSLRISPIPCATHTGTPFPYGHSTRALVITLVGLCFTPMVCSHLHWASGDCSVRPTGMSNHSGPWHGHDSAP